jgi:benzoyl-CoA reductase subunit C
LNIDDIVQQCRDLLDLLPGDALENAREAHPNIRGFGVFPVYAPIEVIHAAGLMPIGLFGAGNAIEISHADSRFQSFICSIAKSTLELFLADHMREFEGAVFSSICDVARNLASLVKRNAPDIYVEYLHLPQNMTSAASASYTRAEFERFRANLAKHLGREIGDAAIRRSLSLYNRVRALTRELYDYRRNHACALAASELYVIAKAGTRMMPEEFVRLLEQVVEQVKTREVRERDGVKVVIEGAFCEQPPVGLIDVIEAAGCRVQDDDLVIGWRLFPEDVAVNGDPVAALADAYLFGSVYTSVRHDLDHPRTDGLIHRMKRSGAESVIFAPAKFCEPALLDYVLFRGKLDEADVPHLKVEFEEKMWTFEASRTEIETFAESMLFD